MTEPSFVHSLENEGLREQYSAAGFGGRVGWGRQPALLVIDMASAWTHRGERLGSDLEAALTQITRLLLVAREQGLPIFFTTMAWDPSLVEIGEVVRRKTPHSAEMVKGSDRVELRPELDRQPDEPLLVKPRASAFFGTHLLAMLISAGVDTVVVTGCSTSGCIRATCEDAFNQNLHVIVPREAVGDRSPSAHEANLFDIDARYGDVMPVEEVLDHLGSAVRSEQE
jgi:nicotinamidase-related amidase